MQPQGATHRYSPELSPGQRFVKFRSFSGVAPASADLAELRRVLLTVLDAVYVDAREARAVVSIRPKAVFCGAMRVVRTALAGLHDSGIAHSSWRRWSRDLAGSRRWKSTIPEVTCLQHLIRARFVPLLAVRLLLSF